MHLCTFLLTPAWEKQTSVLEKSIKGPWGQQWLLPAHSHPLIWMPGNVSQPQAASAAR